MWRVRVCRPEETVSLAVLSFCLVSTIALRSLCCCRVLGFRCVPPNPAFFLKGYLFIYLVQALPPPTKGHPGIHFVGLGSDWPSDSDSPASVSWVLRLKACAGYMFSNTWQVKCSPVRLDIHLSNNIRWMKYDYFRLSLLKSFYLLP